MRRIYAARVVAPMADLQPRRNRSVRENPRMSVGTMSFPSAAFAFAASFPRPARSSVAAFNMAPEIFKG